MPESKAFSPPASPSTRSPRALAPWNSTHSGHHPGAKSRRCLLGGWGAGSLVLAPSCTCPSAPPERATCAPEQGGRVGGGAPVPTGSTWRRQVLPPPAAGCRARGGLQAGAHDVTRRWGAGPGGTPHPRTEARGPLVRPLPAAGRPPRFPLSLRSPRFRKAAAVRG